MIKYKFYIFGLLGAILIWPIDAMVDVYFFSEESFIEELIHPSALEIYFRSTVTLFLAAFAIYAQHSTNRLRWSNDQFSGILELAHDAIIVVDQQHKIILYNQRATKIFGYSEEEILGKPINTLIPTRFREGHNRLVEAFINNNQKVKRLSNIIGLRKNGEEFPAEASLSTSESDKQKIITVILHDITKRKQAETEIESLARFTNENPSPVLRISEDSTLLYANDASKPLLDVWDCCTGEKVPENWARLCKLSLAERNSRIEEEYCAGNVYEILIVPVHEGPYINLYGRNITARIEAEKTAAILMQAIENTGEAIIITDTNGIIEYVNPAFTETTGYLPDEAIGKDPSILKSDAQDEAYYKELWQTISSGRVWHGTLIDRAKDGHFYPAMTSIAPIQNKKGETTHYVAMHRDMTEQHELEAKFQQAQKMEALGTLVGGVAHDFNNMLSGITGNLFLARRKIQETNMVMEKLENIETLSNRAADMIKQMLVFSRNDKVEKKTFSITPFLKEAIKLARSGIPENIHFTCHIATQDIFLQGNHTQLQQLLMNLLMNARDALANASNPEIHCHAEPFYADEWFRKRNPNLKTKNLIRLSISDNGDGILQNNQDKVFEPFFTTKGVGKGTGLGLAMVYGAVQQHHGVIELESEVGKGATFNVYLPQAEQQSDAMSKATEEAVEGRGETILIVDDEADVRNTSREALSSLGYNVIEATNGEEALEKYHANDIDLLITDLVMPIMSGSDLAIALRKQDENIPVIFVTGYDRDQALEKDLPMDNCLVISKPFSFNKLSKLIRSIIESASHQKELPLI